jgi:hypothetical protein
MTESLEVMYEILYSAYQTEVLTNLSLKAEILRLENSCKHPNCGCVCGHTGKCPEDGPCAV